MFLVWRESIGIDPNCGSGTRVAANGTPDGKEPAVPGTSSSASSVHISDLSAQLTCVDPNVSATAPFDSQKVEHIKAAITGGKFRVNAGAIADKLIANVKEILDGRAGR